MQLGPRPVRMPDQIVCNAATTDRSWKVAEPRCCETQFASFNEAMGGGGAGIHYSNHATVMELISLYELLFVERGYSIKLLRCRSYAILRQEVVSWSVARQVKSSVSA